jgi:hypothetical protein
MLTKQTADANRITRRNSLKWSIATIAILAMGTAITSAVAARTGHKAAVVLDCQSVCQANYVQCLEDGNTPIYCSEQRINCLAHCH